MSKEGSRIEALKRNGWTKQFVACEPRLSEAVEMYQQTGFEVHLEPLPKAENAGGLIVEEAPGECRKCFDGFEDQYKVIFTRPKKDTSNPDDDLI